MKEKHTEYFIRHAEALTGYPVVLEEDPSLPIVSTSDISEVFRSRKFVVRYNQTMPEHVRNHAICNQMVYIERVWDAVKKQRYRIMTKNPRSVLKAIDDINAENSMPFLVAAVIADKLVKWQLSDLYSVPIAIRNEHTIFQYEWHREEQNAALLELLSQKSRMLKDAEKAAEGYEIKFHNNAKALYSALALGLSPLISEDHRSEIVRPFEECGDVYGGEELIKTLNAVSDTGHDSDIQTVDSWARKLGLDDWYEWSFAGFSGGRDS